MRLVLASSLVALAAANSAAYGPPVRHFAGSGNSDDKWVEGAPAVGAVLYCPSGIAAGPDGSVYVSDYYGYRIVRISPSGVAATFVGNGAGGYSGDGGAAPQAQVKCVTGIAVDAAGTVYFCDTGNHRIRRVDATGTVVTVAGSGTMSFGGDGGPATAAALFDPIGICFLPDGSLVFADTDNSRIRSVRPDGVIRTIAGTGVQGFLGDGGPAIAAQLDRPHRVAALPDGSVAVSDTYNHRVRRIGTDGRIETILGAGGQGFSGVPGNALSAKLRYPRGLMAWGGETLFVADTGNGRVLQLRPGGAVEALVGPDESLPDGELPKGTKFDSPVGRPADLARLGREVLVVDGRNDKIWILDPSQGPSTNY